MTAFGSALAASIQPDTWLSVGTWRTSFFCALISVILAARLSARLWASSATVSTPAASSRSEYWVPIPFTLNRSALFTHLRMLAALIPVAASSSCRPFAVPAAYYCTREALGLDKIVLATDYPFEQMHLGIDFIKSLPISDHERTQVCETNTRELLKL